MPAFTYLDTSVVEFTVSFFVSVWIKPYILFYMVVHSVLVLEFRRKDSVPTPVLVNAQFLCIVRANF